MNQGHVTCHDEDSTSVANASASRRGCEPGASNTDGISLPSSGTESAVAQVNPDGFPPLKGTHINDCLRKADSDAYGSRM